MGFRSHSHPQTCKVQHTKGIANILADSVSRQAVGLSHDLYFQNSQTELVTPFEPFPPVSNPYTHRSMQYFH